MRFFTVAAPVRMITHPLVSGHYYRLGHKDEVRLRGEVHQDTVKECYKRGRCLATAQTSILSNNHLSSSKNAGSSFHHALPANNSLYVSVLNRHQAKAAYFSLRCHRGHSINRLITIFLYSRSLTFMQENL